MDSFYTMKTINTLYVHCCQNHIYVQSFSVHQHLLVGIYQNLYSKRSYIQALLGDLEVFPHALHSCLVLTHCFGLSYHLSQ